MPFSFSNISGTAIIFMVICLPTLAFAQVPPEKAIATMTVADGLQIELFASEVTVGD